MIFTFLFYLTTKISNSSLVSMNRLLCPWNSPSQNTGVGSCSLVQEIFPTQGLNLGLLNCRRILYPLSHQRSPKISNGSLVYKWFSLLIASINWCFCLKGSLIRGLETEFWNQVSWVWVMACHLLSNLGQVTSLCLGLLIYKM